MAAGLFFTGAGFLGRGVPGPAGAGVGTRTMGAAVCSRAGGGVEAGASFGNRCSPGSRTAGSGVFGFSSSVSVSPSGAGGGGAGAASVSESTGTWICFLGAFAVENASLGLSASATFMKSDPDGQRGPGARLLVAQRLPVVKANPRAAGDRGRKADKPSVGVVVRRARLAAEGVFHLRCGRSRSMLHDACSSTIISRAMSTEIASLTWVRGCCKGCPSTSNTRRI